MDTSKELSKNNSSLEENLRPETIMHNIFKVFPSIAMLAGMQLDVFTPLKEGSMEAKAIANTLGVCEEKLAPLLYSLVVAGVLEVDNEKFSNTDEAAKFLVRGEPDYMGGLSGFYAMTFDACLKTAASISTGEPQAKLDFHSLSEGELLKFFDKQFHSSLRGGKEIATKFDFSPFENLLDAGGGSAGVSIAICTAYPHLKATIADLPTVTKLAERFIAEAGLSDRIDVSATDLCSDSPTGKFDVAILRAFIQTMSKEEARMSLQNISRSIIPGGKIFIFGSVLDNSYLGPPASLAFSLTSLNVYDHGKAYTENEYKEMLINANFNDIKVEFDILDGTCLVSAKKYGN